MAAAARARIRQRLRMLAKLAARDRANLHAAHQGLACRNIALPAIPMMNMQSTLHAIQEERSPIS